MSFGEIVNTIRRKVAEESDPSKLKGMNAVIQFELTGDGGGIFHTRVAEEKVEIVEAAHENPNVSIIIPLEDLKKMMAGQLSATAAFIAGKLKIKGDLSLAMRLQSLIGSASGI